jgi:hypothetical protein
MPRKRLGEILLERRAITPPQLDQALAYQRQTGHRLGAALVALGSLSEASLADALAQALGLKAVPMPPAELDWTALHSLRSRFCEANDLFPLSVDGANPARKTMVVAMADPLNIPAIEEIEFTTGFKVVPVIATLSGIRATIRRYYLKDSSNKQVPGQMTVMRAGGAEDVIHDPARAPALPRAPQTPPAPPPTPAPPPAVQRAASRPPPAPRRRTEEEMPVLQGDALDEPREITERTALANLIKDRAEKRRRRKGGATAPSVDEDLDYLFGVKSESPSDELAKLESRFWALLRIMAKKGLISREEFLKELADKDE